MLLTSGLLAGCTGGADVPEPASAGPQDAAGEGGAVAAAAEHVRLLNSPVMYDRYARAQVLDDVVHPDAAGLRPDLEEGYDRVAAVLGLDEQGQPSNGTLVARAAVLGAEAVRAGATEARVRVWTVGLLGVATPASTQPVQQRWSTEVVDVQWDGDRWRYAGLRHEDGPVPVAGTQLPSPAEDLAGAPAPLPAA